MASDAAERLIRVRLRRMAASLERIERQIDAVNQQADRMLLNLQDWLASNAVPPRTGCEGELP